ncbi:hypothetical protein A2Z10_03750 [Candidatus Azambacteria bacterium RBG_16_47_10]|uniref:Response regulatory domain-containing protein n=1 Tax=Candidatus Azambacteria bacterium RBG_16_47_10 TaxID=1797292 RepID=A0A1F5AXW5_9BACT|nr:MAG: hypothetical protein A2Z10_03750 [Candidatus Azambacteria bacterium RBG_16_47_10]
MNEHEKKTVLVIEDERPLLEAIKIKLELSGFDVVTAVSPKQGLNMLRDIPRIDAVWLDHYLSVSESGLDFLMEVKKSDEWKHIPVFAVTNTASAEHKYSYLELGVAKYYVKADMRLEDIAKDIREFLEQPTNN